MNNKEFIKVLSKIAFLLEIKGENPFKIKAYTAAAEYLAESNINIADAVQSGEVKNIPGFGKAIQEKAIEFVQTGKLTYLENLAMEVPESLYDLKRIKGLGAKKIKQLWLELGIVDIDTLEDACVQNKLPELKGFTEKSQEEIFNSLSHQKAGRNKLLQDRNTKSADELIALLKSEDGINNAEFSGEMRRFSEVISEINIQIESDSIDILNSEVVKSKIQEIEATGVRLKIEINSADDYFWSLHNDTGNKEYIEAFNFLLQEKGYRIENNILMLNSERVNIQSEEELYSMIGLQFVPSELRESADALIKAQSNQIPKLIENCDMKGMLHIHTDWSDGQNSIREMALQSKALGFDYVAICDHSAYAAYANGLEYDRVRQQFLEIDRLNEQGLGINILKAIESDILPDGSLDYTPEILSEFDIVVASVHSGFRMNKADMTKRLIKAATNPYTTIIGHPTGRLLLTRAGYEIDVDEFIVACADSGKVIEINANPYRLDFSWQNALKAKDKGVKLAINPDSHKKETLSDVFIGVKSARKAWLSADDVINCLSYTDFINQYVKRK